MAEKPPFLEDGSQFGVSRTVFRKKRTAEKRELVVQWFHENFEDPTNSTFSWLMFPAFAPLKPGYLLTPTFGQTPAPH